MQKIFTKEERNKKTKRDQLIVGGILITLMILSTLGFALDSDRVDESEKIKYRGIEFIKGDSGYWNFNVQGHEFATKYNPNEVEDISFFNYLNVQDYANKPLYFVGDYSESIYEISRNLNGFTLRFNNACLEQENCSGSYPIKNCLEDNIMIIEENEDKSKKNEIVQENNCIFIRTDLGNQTRYADAVLFDLLGI